MRCKKQLGNLSLESCGFEVFGAASDYRAEEIPWDAAPLPKLIPGAKKY